MIVLIVKDSATQVPREVQSFAEAQAFADQGHVVLVANEDGTKTPLAQAIADMQQAVQAVGTEAVANFEEKQPDAKPQSMLAKVKRAITGKK